MEIRPSNSKDVGAVHEVHLRTFDGRSEEPRLVKLLHANEKAPVSLVAVLDGRIVAHVLFSLMVGLAPIGVLPEYQNRGIGSCLIREGLAACRDADYDAVVVLGEPGYYARFGFERASDYGLDNEYGVDAEFMVVPLKSESLDGTSGTIRYQPEFRDAGSWYAGRRP